MQGSNGEYAYLTPEERVGMVKKVRELAPKHKQILAGSGCECRLQHKLIFVSTGSIWCILWIMLCYAAIVCRETSPLLHCWETFYA